MSVLFRRLSRAAALIVPIAGMALVFAAACGRDITGTGSRDSAVIRFRPAFQTSTSGQSGDDVVAVRIFVTAFNTATNTSRVIANVVPNIDSLQNNGSNNNGNNNNQADTVGVVSAPFPIQGAGFTYSVVLKAVNSSGDTTYQAGPGTFTSNDISAAGAVTVSMRAVYIGPGANATRVVASPRSANIVASNGPNGPSVFQFTAQAYDASGAALARALYEWVTLDTTVARVDDRTGRVFARDKRGSTQVVVTALGAANPTDTVVVNVSLPASAIVLVSGGGQTGSVSRALAIPIVVKSVARDGVPVGGVTVTFQPNNGGMASPTTAATNTSGIAQSTWSLGPSPGTQSLTVSSSGAPSPPLNVPATATALAEAFSGSYSASFPNLTDVDGCIFGTSESGTLVLTITEQSNGSVTGTASVSHTKTVAVITTPPGKSCSGGNSGVLNASGNVGGNDSNISAALAGPSIGPPSNPTGSWSMTFNGHRNGNTITGSATVSTSDQDGAVITPLSAAISSLTVVKP